MAERSRSAWIVMVAVLACVCVCVCEAAFAAPITVTDDRGAQVSFDRSPARIVSLLPSLTESVCALGACDRLVGTDSYSNEPASVRALPKLGGLVDTQVERVASLQPDVILVARSARTIERFEALGFKVVSFDSQTHADVRRTLTLLARLLDTPAAADRVWSAIERDLATAAARVPRDVRGRSVYVEAPSAPYAAGAGSFIGETLTRLGTRNIAPDALGPFPRLNPEFVIRANPDIVVAAQRALSGMGERPGWDRLAALQDRQTCGFDAARFELLIRPGPRLGEAALLLADCLAALPAHGPR